MLKARYLVCLCGIMVTVNLFHIGNGAQGRNQPVRARHRHEDFQINSRLILPYFSTTYGASIAGLCTTKYNDAQLIPAKLRTKKS